VANRDFVSLKDYVVQLIGILRDSVRQPFKKLKDFVPFGYTQGLRISARDTSSSLPEVW
jgi:hypothetical protein